jgi:hypothetical protein
MRLIFRSDKGKAGVFYRVCLDLPSAACPPARPFAHSRMAGLGWPAPKPIRKPRAGPDLIRPLVLPVFGKIGRLIQV